MNFLGWDKRAALSDVINSGEKQTIARKSWLFFDVKWIRFLAL